MPRPPGLLRKDLLQLSEQWMADARVLFAGQRFASAYHAGGIALECILKARIAKSILPEEFPDKNLARDAWDHDPTKLLKLGELETVMSQAPPAVQTSWATVKDWKIDSRYTLLANPVIVGCFLDALDHQTDGILIWLRNHC